MTEEKGSKLEKAISRLDAKEVLSLAMAKEGGVFEAVQSLWASDALYEKRPAKKAALRDPFLNEVAAGFAADHPEASAKVLELTDILMLVEQGFTRILARSKTFPGAKLSPITQVSAAFSFACAAQAKYESIGLEQLPPGPAYEMRSNLSIGGVDVNPDTQMFGVLKAANSTLMMMAYGNQWFNSSDQIELPQTLSRPSADEATAILPVLEFANVWHVWDRAQLRLRLGLRSIEYLEKPYPDEFPALIESVLQVLPDDEVELVDFIANDRLLARTKQHYAELLQHEKRSASYADLTHSVPLPPSGFLSFDEKLGLVTLAECTSFDVTQDHASYAGLRIVEWLRAYAVLKRIAEQENTEATKVHECPQFSEKELVDLLECAGLAREVARAFLQHACLTKDRNDVFDRPLIRVAGDCYVLVVPALKPMLLGPVVLSAISDAGTNIEIKGAAFEKTIRDKVAGPGRQVGFFKTKRAREEYDYDALLVWGDFCFLLECKNRSLSGGILQQVYRSELESRRHAHQVHRLVRGLMAHPDMLDAHFPAARGKLLVPCVISALPYSVPGGIEGVLFGDYSMLTRFFASPVIGQVGFRPGEPGQRQPGGEIFRLWAGDKPTPLELLRHLMCSFQFLFTQRHTGVKPILTGVMSENDVLLHGEYATIDPTLTSSRAVSEDYEASVPKLSLQEWESHFQRLP
jgi:hypothetical protein